MATVNIELPNDLSQDLDKLAAKTGRSKSYYVCRAIEELLLEYKDGLLALSQLEEKNPRISYDEMLKRLGLEN